MAYCHNIDALYYYDVDGMLKSNPTRYFDLYSNCLQGTGEGSSLGYHVTIFCIFLVVQQSNRGHNMVSAGLQGVFAVKYHAEVKVNFFRPLNSVNLKKKLINPKRSSDELFQLNW